MSAGPWIGRANLDGTGANQTFITGASRPFGLAVDALEPNQPPTADAGDDQTVDSKASVSLDGSGSTDPDAGDTLDYAWSQTSGPSVSLNGADTARPSFTAPLGPATLEFELEVCDPVAACDSDTVEVTVEAPTIDTLIASVEGLDLPTKLEHDLLKKLNGAQNDLAAGKTTKACDKLASFIKIVSNERNKKIPAADADALIAEAEAVRESLGCG